MIFGLELAAASTAQARTYSTNLPLAENPVSESGNWTNGKANGLDWSDAKTAGSLAFGTESGSGGYDDSTAILTGTWGPNQSAQATVHSANQSSSVYEEVELRLRSSISPHSATGYEITFRCLHLGGYVQIVRWNGPLGSYTYINQNGNSNYHGITDGDVVSASISGNLIIAYVNGVEVIRGTDSTYATGNPGMGFFLQGGTSALNGDFGFTSFTASDGSSSTMAPSNAKVTITISAIFGHAAQGLECGAAVLQSLGMMKCAAPAACPSPAIFRISPAGARLARTHAQNRSALPSASSHLTRCDAQAGLHSLGPPPPTGRITARCEIAAC
jgi:hypothetical protein